MKSSASGRSCHWSMVTGLNLVFQYVMADCQNGWVVHHIQRCWLGCMIILADALCEKCANIWVLLSMRRPFHLNESSTVRVNLWRYSSVAFKSIEITICLQSAELASKSNGALVRTVLWHLVSKCLKYSFSIVTLALRDSRSIKTCQ